MTPARRFVDLHTHSTASDGSASPAEVIDLAERQQLAAVALTDHDTTAGLAQARQQAELYSDLQFVGGIEVSAIFPHGVLHILGLNIDEASPGLGKLLAGLRAAREERNPKIIARLQQLGLNIEMADVLEQLGPGPHDAGERIVSRVHIARALQAGGHVQSITEAFTKYISNDAPAYVDKEHIEPAAAIAAIREAHGAAVLAHPPQLRYKNSAQLERILRNFIDAGLNGIEVYHSTHSPQQTR
ncbi:MAG: PHP domain-containing protein, partial [Phycisphaerae bacterium]|nr:PHP domain-containing protein [Phycisphaerae bacterium]